MTDTQINLNLAGRPSAGTIIERIRVEEGSLVRTTVHPIALQQPEFEIDKFLGGPQQPVFSLRWIVADSEIENRSSCLIEARR